MAKYRPDIKPPMWGPPEAVQYAVRANAERMGINTADIGTLLALWEGGGDDLWSPFGYQGSRNGAGWSNNGLVTTSAEGLVDAYLSPDQSQLAIAIGFTAYSSRKQGLFCKATSVTKGITCGTFNPGDYIRAYVASTSASLRSNLIPVVGRHYNMVLVYDGSLANDQRIKFFVDGQNVGLSSVSGTIPTTLGEGSAAAAQIGRTSFFEAYSWLRWDGLISHFYILEGDVPDPLAGNLSATPYALLMPVSRPVYFDLGAGGGSYTETLDTLITSISSVADQQAYRDTVDTLITSGATVESVTGMVEALLSLGVSASTAADVQGYVDGVSDTIVSAGDAADAQDYVDGPATTGVSSSDESDTQAYTDTLADTLVSASNVTETTGTPPISESLLTTAVSASNVSAAQAYVETVTALAVAASSIGEVLGLVEQIGTVGESVSSLSDRQLYYDNVAIVALSSSSLAAVGAYIEQVSAAAVSASSLTDVLVGSFVGRYVFADYCRPRSFADYARARSFEDYCRPRGRRLQ